MIKGISHLGVAVRDLEKARTLWRDVFRLDPEEPIVGGGGRVRVSMVHLENAVVELLEGVGADSPVAKFIEKHGEGVQHVCFEVDDIHAEVAGLRAGGLEIIGAPMPGAEGLSVFIHPKGTHGVLVELVQKGPQAG